MNYIESLQSLNSGDMQWPILGMLFKTPPLGGGLEADPDTTGYCISLLALEYLGTAVED